MFRRYQAVDGDLNLLNVWASAPDRSTVSSCREDQGSSVDSWSFGRGSTGCTSETTDK